MNKALILLFIGFTTVIHGQKIKGPNFDLEDFNQKMKVAEWLYAYDMVAWKTSDSVLAQDKKEIERLGSDWFCFQEDDIWHAVYGNFEDNQFDLVFHFLYDTEGRVSRTWESVDTTLLHRYSRALQTASGQLVTLKDTLNLRFNQYIKENLDKTISVWILPAFQPNGFAVFGGEFIYKLNAEGTQILQDDSYYQGEFKGYKVDNAKEIWLDYQETEKPTTGAVFFAWYYKSYFAKIVIDNAESASSPYELEGEWTWIHVEKEQSKKKRRRRKK